MPSFRRSEFVEVAAGLQYPEGPVSLRDGSLVAVDVMAGSLLHIEPDPERPGRFLPPKSIVLGGSPNGAAVGPDGAIYVCNSGGFDFETLPLRRPSPPGISTSPRSSRPLTVEATSTASCWRMQPSKSGARRIRWPRSPTLP